MPVKEALLRRSTPGMRQPGRCWPEDHTDQPVPRCRMLGWGRRSLARQAAVPGAWVWRGRGVLEWRLAERYFAATRRQRTAAAPVAEQVLAPPRRRLSRPHVAATFRRANPIGWRRAPSAWAFVAGWLGCRGPRRPCRESRASQARPPIHQCCQRGCHRGHRCGPGRPRQRTWQARPPRRRPCVPLPCRCFGAWPRLPGARAC